MSYKGFFSLYKVSGSDLPHILTISMYFLKTDRLNF